jgi:hypothetical protein
MTSRNGAEITKHWGESPGRKAALVAAILLPLCLICVVPLAAKGLPVDQAGATMMSCRALIETPAKFDRKFVWVLGGLKFINKSAYLGAVSAQRPDLQGRVCVAPIESITGTVVDPSGSGREEILRRFDGLGVSVHGRYESAATSRCPNGTLFVALLEVSFE